MRTYKNGQTIEYTYDPLGRRNKKADVFGDSEYLWDGDVLIHEQRNSHHVNSNQSDNLSIIYIHEPGRFNPICQIRNDEVYYYHTDHTGTPHMITNIAAEVVWKAKYRPYGAAIQYDAEVIDNPIRFPGQYYDPETGLHYSRHRYYHPVIGRFIQQNPLGLEGGSNNYEYAPNPIGWMNPLGLKHKEVFDKRSGNDAKEHRLKRPISNLWLRTKLVESVSRGTTEITYSNKKIIGKCKIPAQETSNSLIHHHHDGSKHHTVDLRTIIFGPPKDSD